MTLFFALDGTRDDLGVDNRACVHSTSAQALLELFQQRARTAEACVWAQAGVRHRQDEQPGDMGARSRCIDRNRAGGRANQLFGV